MQLFNSRMLHKNYRLDKIELILMLHACTKRDHEAVGQINCTVLLLVFLCLREFT